MNAKSLVCSEVEPLLSDALDNELSDAEARLVHEHLIRCARCRAEHESLRQAMGKLASVSLVEPTDETLDALWRRPGHRLTWNTGVALALGGVALLIVYGAYQFAVHFDWNEFIRGDEPVVPRVALAGIAIGVLLILVQTVRERLKTYRKDPYNEVKR